MFSVKLIALVLFVSFMFAGGGPAGCRSTNGNSQENKAMPPTTVDNSSELKVIAEGFHSSITTPFVAVIRDPEIYAVLRGLAGNLPDPGADFFESHIVIAAFLGERNTGGYGVEINRDANGQIRVVEKAPGKGMMVPQVITAPFKVVSLSVSGMPPVSLSLGETSQQRAQLYRISSGTFSVSGGFAGGTESFQLAGKLQVQRLGGLITIGFAVVSSGAPRERMLRDSATGLVKDHAIVISKLNHGSLLNTPSGDLHASGTFVENKLILNLDSGPVTVPDGYSGRGHLEAELVAASAN